MPLSTIYSVGEVTSVNDSEVDGLNEEVDQLGFLDTLRDVQNELVSYVSDRYENRFLKHMDRGLKKVKGQLTDQQILELDAVRKEFMQDFRQLLSTRFEAIVDEEQVQDGLQEISDLSVQLSEEGDFLAEIHPKTREGVMKISEIKSRAEELFTQVNNETQDETTALKEDQSANKSIRKIILKVLDKCNAVDPVAKQALDE